MEGSQSSYHKDKYASVVILDDLVMSNNMKGWFPTAIKLETGRMLTFIVCFSRRGNTDWRNIWFIKNRKQKTRQTHFNIKREAALLCHTPAGLGRAETLPKLSIVCSPVSAVNSQQSRAELLPSKNLKQKHLESSPLWLAEITPHNYVFMAQIRASPVTLMIDNIFLQSKPIISV